MPAKKKRHTQPDCPSLSHFPMKLSPVIWLAVLIALALGAGQLARAGKASETRLSRLSGDISVHASGRGNPRINLSDGRDVLTSYSGPVALTNALQDNEAQPLALGSADFDEDGVPDLICGYAHSSLGIMTWLRGNVDSIYENSPDAQRRKAAGEFSDAPFLSPARVFELPIKPEFLGAGDFDGDSHWDVVAASRESNALYLMSGDGSGGFKEPRRIPLPGAVTAFVTGEMDRPDGLDDIVIAVAGSKGPKLLVFEGSKGAFEATPEIFDLTAEATDLALGQLDDRFPIDLAVAAGHELVIVRGRNWNATLNNFLPDQAPPVIITRHSFDFAIRSLAIGDFSGGGDHASSIALLSEDGVLHLLARENTGAESNVSTQGGAQWKEVSTPAFPASISRAATRGVMTTTRVSSLPTDDLLLLDPLAHQLHIATSARLSARFASASPREVSSLDIEGEPVAVLPMRLNADARKSLVVLHTGHSNPSVLLPQAAMTFTVTNTDDNGTGTLRQAIIDANANAGADTIVFNIPSPAPIMLKGFLPKVTEALTIDGFSQPGFQGTPVVELDGSKLGDDAGLVITGGNSVVRGLVIHSFGSTGVQLSGTKQSPAGHNVIEGNFIRGNKQDGISTEPFGDVFGSNNNLIGGTHPNGRNVISGNKHGIRILGKESTSNLVQGNYIGTDITGSVSETLGNANEGVFISDQPGNTIGGMKSGAGNLISGNGFTEGGSSPGLAITGTGATGNCVQGNYLGTNFDGTQAIGNASEGVLINQGAGNNTIGGPTAAARNIISGNKHNGVVVGSRNPSPALMNIIKGNYIGVDKDGTHALGNFQDGVLISEAGNPSLIVGNVISSNGCCPDLTLRGHGVSLGGAFEDEKVLIFGGKDSVVKDNWIGTDKTGLHDLGNFKNGIFVENNSVNYTIKNNVIAFNKQNGICVPDDPGDPKAAGTPGFSILMSRNQIFSNTLLGIDLGTIGFTKNEPVNPVPGKANLRQNFPVLNSVQSEGSTTTVEGTFHSAPKKPFTVEFFSNQSGTSSDCRQGRRQFVSSITVKTDANGNAPIKVILPVRMSGQFINSTARDPGGNTSEFSDCAKVSAAGGPELTKITVTSKLVAVGKGFMGQVHVSVLDHDDQGNPRELTFLEDSKLKGDYKVVQNGNLKLPDGTSISLEEAVPPGKLVQIKFRNGNGTETVVPFKK